MNLVEYKDYLVQWIKDTVNEAGLQGCVVGVSGGVDSSVVANLIKEAFPNHHLGVVMPINSSDADMADAKALIKECGINSIEIDLECVLAAYLSLYKYQNAASIANMKARLRMVQLYALASEHNYLVVGTDNVIEWNTGYFTKYGDGGVDLVPLIHLTKDEVYELAKLYEVPNNILVKAPSAGLVDGVVDEDELGITYDVLNAYYKGQAVSSSDRTYIQELEKKSEHKRYLPKAPISFSRNN